MGVAALRAAHQLFDAEPHILEDPIAIQLLEPDVVERLRAAPAAAVQGAAFFLRSHVVVRSRYAEDCLADAARRGVGQYVILGAGLDTFAWRQPGWAAALQIYEVDQPASQHDKRARLHRAGLASPPNLRLVPVDFEVEALDARLTDAGLDRTRPVFFSWLGVMPYLHEPAIDDVLRVIAQGAAGTEVVLSFAPADDGGGPSRVEQMAAAVGEQFRSHFTPAQLEEKLRAGGFVDVSFLTPADSVARYFAGRDDGLAPPRRTSIARARV